jgi:trigger factor
VKTTLSEREGNTVKLAVEVSSEELQEAFTARLRQVSREVRIPGFRPGKAPAAMVRQRVGDEVILVDAVEEAMPGWFAKAASELGLQPVDRPEIKLDDEEKIPQLEEPLGFIASVTVMPEAVLGQYKGVEAVREPAEAEDEEVTAQMDRLRNEFAELRPVSGRAAQSGDFVTVDFGATLDGRNIEGLQAVDYVFDLGGNRMFADVEAQILGMSPGEEKTFPFAVPEGFPDDLGGKTVDFSVTLKEVKEKVLPPLTDQWTSEISEFPTLLELRQEIRSKIAAGKAHSSEQLFRARAIKAAADNATLELPEVVVVEQAQEMLADFVRSLEAQGGSLEAYVEATGASVEQMSLDMKPAADNNVRISLVLDAIAKAEGLLATDEEVSAVVAQMAAVAKVDAKVLENRLRKSGRIDSLKEQILRDKAADLVVENAVAVAPKPEPADEAEAAPARKPRATKAKTTKAASAAKGKPAKAKEAAEGTSEEPAAGEPESASVEDLASAE